MYYTIFCHKNVLYCILIGFYCLLEYQIISTFEVPSTHCGKQFDPDYATRGTNCLHRLSKMTQAGTLLEMLTCAHCLVLNLEILVYTTFMGVSHALNT